MNHSVEQQNKMYLYMTSMEASRKILQEESLAFLEICEDVEQAILQLLQCNFTTQLSHHKRNHTIRVFSY